VRDLIAGQWAEVSVLRQAGLLGGDNKDLRLEY
jgi:hypothetical protein